MICVDELIVKLASTPPNWTLEAPAKFTPVITTFDPTTPLFGVNVGRLGGVLTTVKSAALCTAPAGV